MEPYRVKLPKPRGVWAVTSVEEFEAEEAARAASDPVVEAAHQASVEHGMPILKTADTRAIRDRVVSHGLTAERVRLLGRYVAHLAKKDPWWAGRKPGAAGPDMRTWSYLLNVGEGGRFEEYMADATAWEAAEVATRPPPEPERKWKTPEEMAENKLWVNDMLKYGKEEADERRKVRNGG